MSKQLYRITAIGSMHRARDPKDKKKWITYGNGEGRVGEILLTPEGAAALSHLKLVPAGDGKAYEVKGPKAADASKVPAGEAKK